MGTPSKEVVLNLVNRSRDQAPIASIDLPAHLRLKQEPVADCRRYDRLLGETAHAA
jgi:hypothetical protein